MRKFLHVDMSTGLCKEKILPFSLQSCGGRALTSFLVAEYTQKAIDRALVIAPGLLCKAHSTFAERCSIASPSPDGERILHSSAGGAVGAAMATRNLAALVITGSSKLFEKGHRFNKLHDLIIDQNGYTLQPTATSGKNITQTLHEVKALWPDASGVITTGPAGEYCLPMAALAFSDHTLQAVGHAGNGFGTLLCGKGIRSILFLHGNNQEQTKQAELKLAVRNFIHCLSDYWKHSECHSHGCSSHCLFGLHKSHAFPHSKKNRWVGFSDFWGTGEVSLDSFLLSRFMSLCDEACIDTFAISEVMIQATEQGLIPKGSPLTALDELEKFSTSPSCSLFYTPAMSWQARTSRKEKKRTEEELNVIMDILGICYTAALAFDSLPEVRQAIQDMIQSIYGFQPDDLRVMAAQVLDVERNIHSLEEQHAPG